MAANMGGGLHPTQADWTAILLAALVMGNSALIAWTAWLASQRSARNARRMGALHDDIAAETHRARDRDAYPES